MKRKFIIHLAIFSFCINIYCQSYKLNYTGNISSTNIYGDELMQFKITSGDITGFHFIIHESQTYNNYHNSQNISNYNAASNITNPSVTRIGPDLYGNYYNKIEKIGIFSGLIQGKVSYSGSTSVNIPNPIYYADNFPVNTSSLPSETLDFLNPTTNCQSTNSSISLKASDITHNCTSIQEAVEELAKWIRLNVSYLAGNGIHQDAVSVYNRIPKSGDCSGQTCLMIAFLRSIDIPVRYVGGVLLNKPYTIPDPYGNLLTLGTSGPGKHAIFEVYYPSQGWVYGDPQISLHYRDANFIKRVHSRDPDEIKDKYHITYTSPISIDPNLPTSDLNTTIGSITSNFSFHDFTSFGTGSQHNLFAAKEANFPVGIYDEIEIVEPPIGTNNCKSQQLPDNTLEFNLGDDINFSAEFTSYYCDTWVTDIYWKIKLHHSGGEYSLISEQYPGSVTCYNPGGCKNGFFWEFTSSSSLPNYDWEHDINGNILGEVVVEAELNDSDILSDSKWISLVCKSDIINTEITSNTTISGCEINLINVVIKNGCTVTCYTDGIVNIRNVSIQDNSLLEIEAGAYDVLIEEEFEVESGSIIKFKK